MTLVYLSPHVVIVVLTFCVVCIDYILFSKLRKNIQVYLVKNDVKFKYVGSNSITLT